MPFPNPTKSELEAAREVQRKTTVTVLRSIADMIEAGDVDDAVVVSVPKNGDHRYTAFIVPTRTKELLAILDETRGWVERASEMAEGAKADTPPSAEAG